MFTLRRNAFKAISTPFTSLVAKPRTFSSSASTLLRIQQNQQRCLINLSQRRLYSDEVPKAAQTASPTEIPATSDPVSEAREAQAASPSEVQVTDETVTEAPSQPEVQDALEQNTAAEENAGNVLYVGNLYFEVTEEQLSKVFTPFGALSQVRLICDNRGLSRGYAFVSFKNVADADAAIASLNQQVFEGRRMVIGKQRAKARNQNYSKPIVAHQPSKTLFIGNMSFEMSDKDLNDLFRDIHNVLDVRVAIDRRTGQPRGFAHADFIDVESAQRAKEHLSSKVVYNRQLRVDFTGSSAARRTPAYDPERHQ